MAVSTWQMLKELWAVTPGDCKFAFVEEFLFNPRKLKIRYQNEIVFRLQMGSRWHR